MSLKQIILLAVVCQIALALPSVRVKREEEEVASSAAAELNPIDSEVNFFIFTIIHFLLCVFIYLLKAKVALEAKYFVITHFSFINTFFFGVRGC